ncbi:hypothetical protein [Streptosporangium canum]|uniref:hypothetical protein n=1 Tax=Streptosporangium canum TaxID=324952 RepID=UPI00116052CA|nr:hypothetical protein [Streptosporangium canum]
MTGVHGFEHAEFEPEVGVLELDPATGEMPVVVVNTEQPHLAAMQAIRTWKDRLHGALPLPVLALVDLIKEHPIGALLSLPAAVAMATGSVAVAVDPTLLQPRPPEVVVITERPTPRPAVTITQYMIVPPKVRSRKGGPRRAGETPTPRPTPRVPMRSSSSPAPSVSASQPNVLPPEPSSITLEPGIDASAPIGPPPSREVSVDTQLGESAPSEICAGGCPTG